MNLNQHIADIYKHPAFNKLISKIKPTELQDDLKQEVAVILLTKEKEQIKRLIEKDELLQYTLGIVWIYATTKNNTFYKTFKKSNHELINEYHERQKGKEIFNNRQIAVANKLLDEKLNMNPNQAHESIIFRKYIELSSAEKVASYFGIPAMHCYEVIRKTRKELIKALKDVS